jgi:hypothetical protein
MVAQNMFRSDLLDALRVVNVVTGSALAGMMFWEALIILPVVASLEAPDGLAALRFAGRRAWRAAPVFGVSQLFSGIALAVLLPSGSSAALAIVGLVFLTAAGLITFGPYGLLDQRVRSRTDGKAADEKLALLPRLARLHTLRTCFYALAAVSFAIAAIMD